MPGRPAGKNGVKANLVDVRTFGWFLRFDYRLGWSHAEHHAAGRMIIDLKTEAFYERLPCGIDIKAPDLVFTKHCAYPAPVCEQQADHKQKEH